MKELSIAIPNETGLHARPASLFVKVAQKYSSKIEIRTAEMKANAKSILGVISLGAVKGTNVVITFDGEDEDSAYEEVFDLFKNNLNEVDKEEEH